MTEVFIHGFSHCGTSITAAMVGRSEEVLHLVGEMDKVPKGFQTEKKHVVYKTPWTKDSYREMEDRVRIFLVRNPLWVYSSLNTRFNGKIPAKLGLGEYSSVVSKFRSWRDNPSKNHYFLKYEDIFNQDFEGFLGLMQSIGISHDKDLLIDTDIINRCCNPWDQIPESKPNPIDHVSYRIWQINQKFRDMNTPDKINLTEEQFNQILKDPPFTSVYPEIKEF